MADLPSPQIESSVLAALQAVKDAGLRSVTRTTLVKFVYLLDCLYAEEHGGQTASKSRWYFDKFGPFARDLVAGIDAMVHIGLLQSKREAIAIPTTRCIGLESFLEALHCAMSACLLARRDASSNG